MDHYLLVISFLMKSTGAPMDHAMAAYAAQTEHVTARQLLRQSWRESRWQAPDRLVVSRMEGGRRKTGYLTTFAGTSGPYFCGTLQLKRLTPAGCRAINADMAGSYKEAVVHIMEWRDYCLRTKRGTADNWKVCALAGYAGGTKGTRIRGKAWRYARAVLREAEMLSPPADPARRSASPRPRARAQRPAIPTS